MYALAIIGGALQRNSIALEMPDAQSAVAATITDVALFGGLMLLCLYLLNGQNLQQLNLLPGSLLMDMAWGFGTFFMLILAVIGLGIIVRAAGGDTVPDQNIEIGKLLANDPKLAAAMLGPVVWIKAAVLEEFSRVFMLSRLWRIYRSPAGRLACLLGVSILFGLAHIWQGWIGVLGTAMIGLVLGRVYMSYGRVVPLIVAHGLYDSVVMLLLIAIGSGTIPLSTTWP
jgi:membrane protease YdiL (CAAX protease family)